MNSNEKKSKRKIIIRLLLFCIILFILWLLFIFLFMSKDRDIQPREVSNTKHVLEQKNASVNRNDTGNANIELPSQSSEEAGVEVTPDPYAISKDSSLKHKEITDIRSRMKEPNINMKSPKKNVGNKEAFIYFSHNRESFLPYFSNATKPEMAYHSAFNVSLVGERLGKALKHYGIRNNVSDADIITMLNEMNLDFGHSYDMSRQLVLEEKKKNHHAEIFFDIHRDALRKENTTAVINGKAYAQILFVVGTGHPNYQANLEFANTLHRLLVANYPGLSKGVLLKDNTQGNGVYNQDLSPKSVIVEIGGVDNKLDELYRTADALAHMVSQY
ncbi:stage II sporulation protein P [Peribacillus saganii]|nr:stage II sporulation protein P [Peribacillus saganii]